MDVGSIFRLSAHAAERTGGYGEMVSVYAYEVISKTPGESKLSPDVLRMISPDSLRLSDRGVNAAAYTLIQSVLQPYSI